MHTNIMYLKCIAVTICAATLFTVFCTACSVSDNQSALPASSVPAVDSIDWESQELYDISTVSFEMHEAFSDRTLPAFDPRNYCMLLGVSTPDGDKLVHASLDKVYLKPNVSEGTTPQSTLLIDGCSMLVANPGEFSSMLTMDNFIDLDEVQVQFCLAYLLYPEGKSDVTSIDNIETEPTSSLASEIITSSANSSQ